MDCVQLSCLHCDSSQGSFPKERGQWSGLLHGCSFLKSSSVDISGWMILCHGPVLCIVGYLVTSWPLPSRYQKQLSSRFFTTSFPGGTNGKEPHLPMQVRHKRCGFNPWVTKFPWRGKWQPTPIFLPGESDGQKGLAGCSWGSHIELDTTELT